jgi:hypothetical protein
VEPSRGAMPGGYIAEVHSIVSKQAPGVTALECKIARFCLVPF